MKAIPQEAIDHALDAYPSESCGLVVDGEYVRCANQAEKPGEHFILSPADYKAAASRGEVQAIIHSHPDYPCAASEADLAGCEESELPWGIIEVRQGRYVRHRWYEPQGTEAPLIGRQFYHGVHDCLSIILDYYKRERGVDLGNFNREDGWWERGGDLYREHLPAAGFVQVDDGPQDGDVVLMQIRSRVPNHAGVFLADGQLRTEPSGYPVPGCILHHLYGQLSRRDVYGGMWAEKTVSIWRYDPKA